MAGMAAEAKGIVMPAAKLIHRLSAAILFCGFAATAQAMTPCNLGGGAVLAGVLAPDCAPVLEAHGRWMAQDGVSTRTLGQDRYGRAVVIPKHGRATLQELLLREGVVVAYDAAATPTAWLEAEAMARTAELGLWGESTDILTPERAAEAMGRFAVVEGKVTRTYKGRQEMYINFGTDWKTDFSVMVPKRAWRSFASGLDGLEGKMLRVRGVVHPENGPMITLTRPEQMERLDANAR